MTKFLRFASTRKCILIRENSGRLGYQAILLGPRNRRRNQSEIYCSGITGRRFGGEIHKEQDAQKAIRIEQRRTFSKEGSTLL